MDTQSAFSSRYYHHVAENLEEGRLLVECKGWSGTYLHDLNSQENCEDMTSGITTPVPMTPAVAKSDTINDQQDTPSPAGSHILPTHYVYAFQKPRKLGCGFIFGSKRDADFRLRQYEAGKSPISKHSFRIFINEFDAWMLSTLSRNQCAVNDDTLCSRKCLFPADPRTGNHMEHLWQIALRPDDVNRIRILDLELIVRVPDAKHSRQAWILCPNILAQHLTTATLQTSDTSSSQSISVRKASSRAGPALQDKYYELLESAVPSNGVYLIKTMINKRTGERALGKIDERPVSAFLRETTLQGTYETLQRLCQDEHYFVRLLEVADVPSGFAIITVLRHAEVLEDCKLYLTRTELLLLFAQIGGGALQHLYDYRLVHLDIRSATILVEYENQALCARLTGFSESKQLPCENNYDEHPMAEDIRALSKLVHEIQTTPNSAACVDDTLNAPSAEALVSHNLCQPTSTVSPSQIKRAFDTWIGGDRCSWPPFGSFALSKTYILDCFSINDGTVNNTYVHLDQVINAVYEISGSPTLPDNMLHHFKRDFVRQIDCIPLRETAKLFHTNRLFDLEEECLNTLEHCSWEDDKTFEIRYRYDGITIHYHKPSSMINLTEISRFIGRSGREVLEDQIQPTRVQEIDGFKDWKGIYVDFAFAREVLRGNSELYKHFLDFRSHAAYPFFDTTFQNIQHQDFIILAFRRLQPHLILLRRMDDHVNIETIKGESAFYDSLADHFVPSNIAARYCRTEKLNDLADYLDNLRPMESRGDWKDRIHLNRMLDTSATSDTSLLTTKSFKDVERSLEQEQISRFRFRSPPILRKKHKTGSSPRDPTFQRFHPMPNVTFEVPKIPTTCNSSLIKGKVTAWLGSAADVPTHCHT